MGPIGCKHISRMTAPHGMCGTIDGLHKAKESRSGQRGQTKNHFASAEDRTSIARSSSPQPDTILIELPGSPSAVCTVSIKNNKLLCISKFNENQNTFRSLVSIKRTSTSLHNSSNVSITKINL
jgi:hypothetical protein